VQQVQQDKPGRQAALVTLAPLVTPEKRAIQDIQVHSELLETLENLEQQERQVLSEPFWVQDKHVSQAASDREDRKVPEDRQDRMARPVLRAMPVLQERRVLLEILAQLGPLHGMVRMAWLECLE
jgi:hypothetical protein